MTAENILIIRTGAIGDMIHFLPVLEAIREKYPKAFIEMTGYKERLSLLEDTGYVDRITSIDDRDIFLLFSRDFHPVDSLVQYLGRFDIIFSFIRDEEEIFSKNMKKCFKGELVSVPPLLPEGKIQHIVDYLLDCLRVFNIEPSSRNPRLCVGPNTEKEAEDFLKSNHLYPLDNIIAIHPGSGSREKNWDIKRFSEIGKWLVDTYQAKIILITGPAEELIYEDIRDAMKDISPVMAKNLPLKLLSGLIHSCRLFLGNDSGITHVAAALGIPTLSLFGSTDPRLFGPRGKRAVILSEGSMKGITEEAVKKEIEGLMEKKNI